MPVSTETTVSTVSTVADLTTEHIGWEVSVKDEDLIIGYRDLHLLKIRTWTPPDGITRVGLTDAYGASEIFIGTHYTYPADTPCKLLRLLPKRRARRTHP